MKITSAPPPGIEPGSILLEKRCGTCPALNLRPWEESNPHTHLRRVAFYPLNYRDIFLNYKNFSAGSIKLWGQ